METAALRSAIAELVPFVGHLDLEPVECSRERGTVRLPDDRQLTNHVGSQHAGALFTVAETAAGLAFLGAFEELFGQVTPLVREADIDYRRLAKGPITATATVDQDVAGLTATLRSGDSVRFPIPVEMTDEDGEVVATATFLYHARPNG